MVDCICTDAPGPFRKIEYCDVGCGRHTVIRLQLSSWNHEQKSGQRLDPARRRQLAIGLETLLYVGVISSCIDRRLHSSPPSDKLRAINETNSKVQNVF